MTSESRDTSMIKEHYHVVVIRGRHWIESNIYKEDDGKWNVVNSQGNIINQFQTLREAVFYCYDTIFQYHDNLSLSDILRGAGCPPDDIINEYITTTRLYDILSLDHDRIGFTGTRDGMSKEQRATLKTILTTLRPREVHHGDCIGADAEFHEICSKIDSISDIVIHPPKIDTARAFCKAGIIREEKDYLDRDKDIVNETDMLIAAPKTLYEVKRSGTWFTIRYASMIYRPTIIITPDGDMVFRNFHCLNS